MAEAVAAVSLTASIIALVDFGSRALARLRDYESSLEDVPKCFRQLITELPMIVSTLELSKECMQSNSVKDGTKRALAPTIEGCRKEMDILEKLLHEITPDPADSRHKRRRKALSSIFHQSKVERMTSAFRQYVQTLTYFHAATLSTQSLSIDSELGKLRQLLSAPDPFVNHHRALKQRLAKTGLWFLESNEYVQWKSTPASFLWLHGIPGCGKTILCSAIVQDALQESNNNATTVVAFYYFSFNDHEKQQSELMIKSLITQLSWRCVKIPPSVETALAKDRSPLLETLLEMLHQMLQILPTTCVIVDALDECGNRHELLEVLETIARWQVESLHIILTSRKEADISSSVTTFIDESRVISLQSEAVNSDIRNYIHNRLTNDKNLRRWQKDADTQDEIKQALMEKACGMFRWAACQLDALGKCLNKAMLQRALINLPKTLDETYDRILCSIEKDYYQYAYCILRWLAFSARPLLIEEVAEVVAISSEDNPTFDEDQVLTDPNDVLRICSSLVVAGGIPPTKSNTTKTSPYPAGSEMLNLAHYSVKEYLVSERIRSGKAAAYSMKEKDSHAFIASACITYILHQGK